MSMVTHFVGESVTLDALRKELISRSELGDKQSRELLLVLSKQQFPTAKELVTHYWRMAGSTTLETLLAGTGLVAFGLVFGVLALTFNGIVGADPQTLLLLLAAFGIGQCSMIKYGQHSSSRYYAQEFQKLSNIMVASHFYQNPNDSDYESPRKKRRLAYAYGRVA